MSTRCSQKCIFLLCVCHCYEVHYLNGKCHRQSNKQANFLNRNGEATHVDRQYNSQMAYIFHRKKQLLILPVVVKRFRRLCLHDCILRPDSSSIRHTRRTPNNLIMMHKLLLFLFFTLQLVEVLTTCFLTLQL